MPEFLKLAQLAHGDGVTEVQVGGTRIVAGVHPQRTPLLLRLDQALAQFARHRLLDLRVAIFHARHQNFDLLVNRLCQRRHELRS